jgi:hypothetical protein
MHADRSRQTRYEELNLIGRLWMVLEAERRSGREGGIEKWLPSRKDNVCIVCPACPEPGLNMDPNWQFRVAWQQ